jgi:dihydroxyacetone kinase phosphotransfer subunit
MAVALVIVSHSQQVADGVRDIAGQMAGDQVVIRAAGGAADGSVGTNAEAIARAITEADQGDGVLILMDLGSAVLSTETALEMLGLDADRQVQLSNAPLVEGAVVAAVTASTGQTLEEVASAALDAKDMTKVVR